jgi:hypothetical protein
MLAVSVSLCQDLSTIPGEICSNEYSLQPRLFGVAPDGYNAALDLSHTALRAESEGERYTGVLYRPTLAFALRV